MKIIEPGHVYELNTLDGKHGEVETLRFVNREAGSEHPGTQTQEVLRSLIDRTMHCDNCLRWTSNDKISIVDFRAGSVDIVLDDSKMPVIAVDPDLLGHVVALLCFAFDSAGFVKGERHAEVVDEIYLRKDKHPEAEDKPAQFTKMCSGD